MANHVLQKLGSMFTAAILCASCLPFGSVSAAGNNTADADISETIPNLVKSPEQLVQDAERGDFLTLSYATLPGLRLFRRRLCVHFFREKPDAPGCGSLRKNRLHRHFPADVLVRLSGCYRRLHRGFHHISE